MAEYADALSDKIDRPREYLEEQLHMSQEEKDAREVFFTEFFARHGSEAHVA